MASHDGARMEGLVSTSDAERDRPAIPHQVVVPLDGSDTGARALPFAHAFAGRIGAQVVTVHVGGPSDSDVRADVSLDGAPAPALLGFVHEDPGRVLCLSSHGRGGLRRALLGSVAEEVVRGARVPVLVVGPEVETQPPMVLPRTIVVAVGSGADGHGVAGLVRRWAPLLGARIERVHVAEEAAEPASDDVRTIVGGDPAAALLGLADELRGPLLYAVGAPAPEGARSGRPVALRLIRDARWPVLTLAALPG